MYKIKSLIEKDNGRYLYWHNNLGWTKKKYANKFTEIEKNRLRLPTWSKWEKIKER